jgi:hypothetical protein
VVFAEYSSVYWTSDTHCKESTHYKKELRANSIRAGAEINRPTVFAK